VADQIAFGVELQHRRRRVAAFADAALAGNRRRVLGAIEIVRIVAAMHDPHVVAVVDRQADRLSEHPVVGHRLRPERVNLEARRRRVFGLGGG
jgi:hypothetical protein